MFDWDKLSYGNRNESGIYLLGKMGGWLEQGTSKRSCVMEMFTILIVMITWMYILVKTH